MSIKSWNEQEQPRLKLLKQGPHSLSDAELIALFLQVGVKGQSALDLARILLLQFNGLRGLLNASIEQFSAIHGLGLAKFAQLQAALELGRRHLEANLKQQDVLLNTAATTRFLQAKLRDKPNEIFAAIFLTSQNHVISYEELAQGTINGATVYPRKIIARALHHNAASVIFAHNHPSGSAEPSSADINLTKVLKKALNLIEINVFDHFIIGANAITSLQTRGLL